MLDLRKVKISLPKIPEYFTASVGCRRGVGWLPTWRAMRKNQRSVKTTRIVNRLISLKLHNAGE